jgi:kynurenine formamidase
LYATSYGVCETTVIRVVVTDTNHFGPGERTDRVHDLSHRIETGMTTYPGDPDVTLEPAATHDTDGFCVTRLVCGSHAGTHVDAPAHTEPGGPTLAAYPIEAFVRDARRVDCRDLGARDPIDEARVPETDADCLVFHTGWDTHWGTDRYLDHPYLSPAAGERCAELGYAVATDTLSPDPTPTERASADEPDGFPAHHALLGRGLLVFENLRGIGAVPDRFELRAYPLALGGDGAPVRAVGVA